MDQLWQALGTTVAILDGIARFIVHLVHLW